MKILIIRPFPEKINIDSYNVQEIGLAKALIKKGHECGIVFFENGEENSEQIIPTDDGKNIVIYWRKGINILKNGWFSGLDDIIEKYDVIQVHEYDQLYSWHLYSHCKKPVLVYHGPYYNPFNKKYNFKTAVFDKIFLNRRNTGRAHVLTKSKLAEKFLKEKGFKDVTTVGVGLDDSRLSESEPNDEVKKILEKTAGAESFLYVGKIEERRNIIFLLEVFAQVSANRNCKLVLIGNGQEEYKNIVHAKIAELKLNDAIIWVEKLNQDQLSYLYQNCKYFMFPTNYDIFGMVLLETMFYGMTVFSSINGGSSTLIEDGVNGVELEAFDKALWVNRINQILDSEEKDKLGVNAKETIKNKFLWSALVDDFIVAYKKCLRDEKK